MSKKYVSIIRNLEKKNRKAGDLQSFLINQFNK